MPLLSYFHGYARTARNQNCERPWGSQNYESHFWVPDQRPQKWDGSPSEIFGTNSQIIPTKKNLCAKGLKGIEILRLVQDSLGLGRMDSAKVENLMGKLNFFQKISVERIMRHTFPIMYNQLYSDSCNGKLSTQFL